MADTNHGRASLAHADPVEGDGISYPGVIWFVVIMAVTTLASQLLVVGAFKWLDRDVKQADAPRAPLAAPVGQLPPAPNLMYEYSGSPELNEPGNLQRFRAKEDAILTGYKYDKASGVAQIPIDRAKELLLQRGLPTRGAAAPAAAKAAPAAAKSAK
jgi:hypothetical protein